MNSICETWQLSDKSSFVEFNPVCTSKHPTSYLHVPHPLFTSINSCVLVPHQLSAGDQSIRHSEKVHYSVRHCGIRLSRNKLILWKTAQTLLPSFWHKHSSACDLDGYICSNAEFLRSESTIIVVMLIVTLIQTVVQYHYSVTHINEVAVPKLSRNDMRGWVHKIMSMT